ncbi:MAG: adenylate/guanylate cyclase domain-containing protein [Mariprofundaceae bacterium]|nr:adenylate/guanylate cyclase domain-containing protein [Mariprofundaceae bacterium]
MKNIRAIVKDHIPYLLISSIIVLLSGFLTFNPPVFLQFLENKTFDLRFLLRGERPIDDKVAIIAIDHESLQQVGRWPWPRAQLATLIKATADAGAKTIGIDILFPEPSQDEDVRLIQHMLSMPQIKWENHPKLKLYLQRKELAENDDLVLSQAIAYAGNVILPFAPHVRLFSQKKADPVETPDVLFDHMFMRVKTKPFVQPVMANDVLLPLDIFIDEAASMGHVYTQYDRDGAIRWETLAINFNQDYYPVFGLSIARHYLDISSDELQIIAGEAIILGKEVIAMDQSNRALINYAGKGQTFPTYSAADVLNGKLPKDFLENRIALIGLTALGTSDNHVTPFAQLMGVEKQASVIENILYQRFLNKGELIKVLNFSFILAFTLIFLIFISRWRALAGATLVISFVFGYGLLTQYLFSVHLMWVDFLVPTGTIFMLYASLTAFRFLVEEKKARQIKTMFSSYTTEKVVNELLAHPELAKLGGMRREVTVLFSDVRSFTTFSETRTPEEVILALNELLSAMTDVIFKWDGTLDKFVGDEIMVFWGAPSKQNDHALLSIGCALDMMHRLAELQQQWRKEGREELDIGIGMNTGEVVVGNIGCEAKKMDYTIIGDSVNLGARVEALTRNYSNHIMLTEFTYALIKEHLIQKGDSLSLVTKQKTFNGLYLKELGGVNVKGKNKSVLVYELEHRPLK